MNKYILTLLTLTWLSTFGYAQHGQPPALVGLWSLHLMEVADKEGDYHPWNGGMQGWLLYDDAGYAALHLATRDYTQVEAAFANFSPDMPVTQLQHLTKSYYYTARWEADTTRQVVKHTKLSHSNPTEWEGTSIRAYLFKGDTLVLIPVEEENRSLRLKWLPMK